MQIWQTNTVLKLFFCINRKLVLADTLKSIKALEIYQG